MAAGKIDLRSDTITLPTQEMREAMYRCEVGDDVLREDPTINKLEAYAAGLLGKEAALFVPSGTFANQCAIMTHTLSSDEVIVCEDAHIIQHEAGASGLISRVQLRAIAPANGKYLSASEIEKRIRIGDDIHYPRSGLICLEQATAFGNLYPPDELRKIRRISKKYKVPVHIDGARFFNAAVALGVDVAKMADCADSISICLSKGLCAPVGSLLVGNRDFIEKARRNRKILGGGMRQAGFLAAAGLVALKVMTRRLDEDHRNAELLAGLLNSIEGICVERQPEINMVFFRNKSRKISDAKLFRALSRRNILTYPPEAGEFRFVTHYGIGEEDIRFVAEAISAIMSGNK